MILTTDGDLFQVCHDSCPVSQVPILIPSTEAEIVDVGNTGLTPEQEFYNRERKYSATGVDVRRFSKSASGGLEPLNDPYYGRKRVSRECAPCRQFDN